MSKISLIYVDSSGNLQEDPELWAVGINGRQVEVANQDWIDFPAGGELVVLPGRLPLGYHGKSGEAEVVEKSGDSPVTAVGAILPVGYTRRLLPGYEIEKSQELPLYGYTAIGSSQGRLKAAALKTDDDLKWNPVYYNTKNLPILIKKKKKAFPENRIVNQLAKCALEYHCLTAQNIFYERWEAGIPVSPRCNAACLGCISQQPAGCCPSPQGRIRFIPTEQEVVDLAVSHLAQAAEAIISFGQGCEGEPTLQKELLQNSLKKIREQTRRGTININTNAGDPNTIGELADAGLDSIRVSLFSPIPKNFNWYHRPKVFQLREVKESLKLAVAKGLMVSLNLLFFPGFTNRIQETEALSELILETGLKQLQLRNLNLDPEKMGSRLSGEEIPTVLEWLGEIKKRFPELLIGNYSRPVR